MLLFFNQLFYIELTLIKAFLFRGGSRRPETFPCKRSAAGKPIYERFMLDLCPKKRKTY